MTIEIERVESNGDVFYVATNHDGDITCVIDVSAYDGERVQYHQAMRIALMQGPRASARTRAQWAEIWASHPELSARLAGLA